MIVVKGGLNDTNGLSNSFSVGECDGTLLALSLVADGKDVLMGSSVGTDVVERGVDLLVLFASIDSDTSVCARLVDRTVGKSVNISEVAFVDDSNRCDVFEVPDGEELVDVMVDGATVSVSFLGTLDISRVLLVCVDPGTSARLED